jgi:hypothetical protein
MTGSATKQSIVQQGSVDCFVAFRLRSVSYGGRVAPRSDVEICVRDLAARFARVLKNSENQKLVRKGSL